MNGVSAKRKRNKDEGSNQSTESSSSDQESENKRLKLQVEKLTRREAQLAEETRRLRKQLCELLAANGRFAKEYTLFDILGSGGFGIVFGAENVLDTLAYAVKRIAVPPSHHGDKLWEAHVFSRLEHPGIVRYNCTWIEHPPVGHQHQEDGKYIRMFPARSDHFKKLYAADCHFAYIQMQFCTGSLTEWLNDNTAADTRPLPKMKNWLLQLASAIGYLHEEGYIYRDLKPDNVLIYNQKRLKLCDMGIVKKQQREGGRETAQDGPTGSREYMSPEQAFFFAQVTSKTDVFSLGLLFAELTTVMDKTRKSEVFHEYRQGNHINIFGADVETHRFVSTLTRKDPDNRPSCQNILNNSFFEGIAAEYE